MSDGILVTGGCGFVGSMLVDELCQQVVQRVRVLDVRAPATAFPDQVDFLHGSILDDTALSQAMQGCKLVYHVAAIPDLWLADKKQFHLVNTVGTQKVLAAAAQAKVEKLVYTSTESIVVGTSRREGNADEASAVALQDMPGPYCRSKFLAEQAAREAADKGLPVVIVNPTLPIGPGDERLTPPSRMLLGYLNGDYGAYLNSAFNLIHVRDVARGHILAAQHGRIGERYMLAGENLTLRELLAMLQALTGRKMPRAQVPWLLAYGFAAVSEFVADHITHKPPTAPLTGVRLALHPCRFDNAKAREALGFAPRPLDETLPEALAWLRESGAV